MVNIKTFLVLAVMTAGLFLLDSCAKLGCTDPAATNYNAGATKDNGECDYIFGCTDTASINYDASAALDDGSCRSFNSWSNWILEASKTGIDSTLLVAHIGNDTTSLRDVYFRDGTDPEKGIYPEGTMIVKHSRNASETNTEYVGMLKREAGFSPVYNDWEYFMLTKGGRVATDATGATLRGATLLNGYCIGCHQYATTDYVFSK